MSTYREAIFHVRMGGTARCGGKEIRFLTFKEAEPIIIERSPSRRTVLDTDPQSPRHGKPMVENGEIVVETFADLKFNAKWLGLFDLGGPEPIEFHPTEEDVAATDWIRVGVDEEPAPAAVEEPTPEAVAPEAVDEALIEHDIG